VPRAERAYAETSYPSVGYRLLGAFRLWAAVEHFFPYKHLMGESWDAALYRAIPRFEAARDSLEYSLAAAELATALHDSHSVVSSAAMRAYFGLARPGLRVQYVGDQLVVTFVVADSSVMRSGIRAGDVIRRVDGEDVGQRRERLARYLPASTPAGLDGAVAARMLTGAEGSTVTLEVIGAGGVQRSVTLARHQNWRGLLRWMRPGPTWKVMANNIGYVDLERLAPEQVDSMFTALAGTRGIVFDGRGYPQMTVWDIASRLTSGINVPEAIFRRPVAITPDTTERQLDVWVQHFSRSPLPRYTGRTVLMVDGRAVSLAEHTGLLFKAANGTAIIGSQTSGANGDITSVTLPGAVRVIFTGQEVLHADGTQLQRIGLRRDVEARPTVAGIRAGRDEVLDRAVQFLIRGR
jgi:C-terminal processing protease CtpA/Prc